MADYDNKNRFTLFRNTKKREGKQDADFNGTFTDENGREFWINAWSTQPKSGGEKFLSGSVKLKDAPREQPRAEPVQQRVKLDDEIPFAPEFR
jgi:hypothetical protein